MDQQEILSQVFFIRVESKKKFCCIKISFNRESMIVSSAPNEAYSIFYRDIISSVEALGPEQTYSLKINFFERFKSGLIFKSNSQKQKQLNLYSKNQNKVKFWNSLMNQLIQSSVLESEGIQRMKFHCLKEVVEFILKIQKDTINFMNNQIQDESCPQYRDEQVEESKMQIPQSIVSGKFLVFVNPASGKGHAQAQWNLALQILSKTAHELKVIGTEYSGHCKDYIQSILLEDLLQYKGIILVSGDGLPHEAINGIYSRIDWQNAKDIPIGVLPGGSGNAFAKNICQFSHLDANIKNAALVIAKGQTKNIDLVLYETQQGPRIFSFLSLAWTFIADVDLGSEGLRFLGEARFTIFGTWRALFQNKYPGKFYYTQSQIDIDKIKSMINNEYQDQVPNISETMEENYELCIDKHLWSDLGEKNFTYFLIAKQPWISENYYAAPLCQVDDGLMDLQYLCSEDGWSQLVQLALSQESGNHMDIENQQVIKGGKWRYQRISAFRLEPCNSKGNFSIDGEKYPSQRIQGVVIKKHLKVFCM